MYDPASIPEDPAFHEEFGDKPPHYEHISKMWGVRDLPWSEWAKIVARYYGYITLIDDCIGDLIRYLKTNDLYENTLIVFTADHGDAMGAHRLIEKGEFMFDETYRIPFVARHPQCAAPGSVCNEFVYLHDLFPTVAEITGGKNPELADSKSILPLIVGEKGARSGRDFAYGQFDGHFSRFEQRMLRTRTHKLVFNAPCSGELYDLVRDPHEMVNRFADPSFREIKNDLLRKLHEEMIRLKDPLLKWFGRIRDFY
jgi:arylsulfatase A-like enzyme